MKVIYQPLIILLSQHAAINETFITGALLDLLQVCIISECTYNIHRSV